MTTGYPDWTKLMQVIGSDIQVPIDIQGSYIMMPVDIQAQYTTLEIDVVAQSVGNITIDIAAQSIGNLDINIAASAVTLDINIASQAANVDVNIAASAVTLNISGSVSITGVAQVDIEAQSVAVKPQAEWSPQQAQQKYFVFYDSGIGSGSWSQSDYTVTTGKTLYITHISFYLLGYGATYDISGGAGLTLYNVSSGSYLAVIGGQSGNGVSFPTPLKVTSGQTIRVSIGNMTNQTLQGHACWAGYEI